MINTNIMRYLLWAGVAFNALVALMLMFPSTLGAMAALPPIGSVFYRWMLTFFVETSSLGLSPLQLEIWHFPFIFFSGCELQ